MENFIENMELITGTVKALEDAERTSSMKRHGATPDRREVIKVIKDLQSLLFPDYYRHSEGSENVLSQTELLLNIYNRLAKQIKGACIFSGENKECCAEKICDAFIKRLPFVKSMLIKDIEALYEGDPAAKCREEVLICYPGFYAISIYRIAHELYSLGVPLIPRIMTEFAHEKTGIDIHAGAKIGEYFFIDHGTGIVVGETTTIGNMVKIYQGVTLGAKSFKTDASGNPVKNIKRHPDIGNNVVIYANATILGGDTKIGDNCVIGGNVWLTHSVEAGSTVSYE
ncbi:MAG: serine acetyltransferase [Oscillospiraceae bacterium]|nr:serine acetyltransferase [Oscillospiraceae bacterium]